MKILDQDGTEITQEEVNYDLGYLREEYVPTVHHDATPMIPEKGYTKVTVTFADGDSVSFREYPTQYFDDDMNFKCVDEYADKQDPVVEAEYAIEQEYVPAQDEWWENEKVWRYVPYTEEELETINRPSGTTETLSPSQMKELYDAVQAFQSTFADA